jgi:hypothetical protein
MRDVVAGSQEQQLIASCRIPGSDWLAACRISLGREDRLEGASVSEAVRALRLFAATIRIKGSK